MNQTARDKFVFWGLVIAKVLLFARTASDTWAVSQDVINVFLIDGVLMGLWVAAAYGGRGGSALAMRPFAAVGAWAIYASVIVIGWEAHHDVVSIAARIAGAIALAYDTWDLMVSAALRMRIQRKADTFDMYQQREDDAAMRKAYSASIRKIKAGEMQTAINMIAQKRIEGYAQSYLAALPDTTENGYKLLESGNVYCERCGWVSTNAYTTMRKAQPVFAAHTRSAKHRARVADMARIDVTPD